MRYLEIKAKLERIKMEDGVRTLIKGDYKARIGKEGEWIVEED